MSRLDNDMLRNEKEVAYYSALISAWIEARMERDKSLIMLSAGGIGLLITILSTVGVNQRWVLWLYACAFISFLVSIFSCLMIFNRNPKVIEDVLENKSVENHRLARLDTIALSSFLSGILFSISIGVVAGVAQFNR